LPVKIHRKKGELGNGRNGRRKKDR
jgi:hypothetical protein